jgi:bifunctional UDP-N-acetylglucosamine pyrophosphorylase / glucosamine-1-phosphate N-acetyltransferase
MINSDADNPAAETVDAQNLTAHDPAAGANPTSDNPAARAHALYASGLSKADVAREMGISEWAAMIHLRDVQLRYPSRRVRAKDEVRERARALRAEGATYDEIAAELGVSKSSVSLWVRDVTMPVRPYDPERAERAREARWGPRLREREAQRQATKEASGALLGDLSERDLLLLGVVAYWCEGSKDKPYARRERFVFVNSDPDLIRLMLGWLGLMGVENERVTLRVHIHETADVAAAERYWRQVVGPTYLNFRRATIKRHRPSTNRLRTGDDYHGCLVLGVISSASLYWQVEGFWRKICGNHQVEQQIRRGVIGNTPDFGSGIPGPSPGGGASCSSNQRNQQGSGDQVEVACAQDRGAARRVSSGDVPTPALRGGCLSRSAPAAVVVLAAGEGTRMRSTTPKVLHSLAGRTLLQHVLAATDPLEPARTLVVVGHGREQVSASLAPQHSAVVQEQQHGTGHAVRIALAALGEGALAAEDVVLVVPGDAPLLRPETLGELVELHTRTRAAATVLTAEIDDATGYGRIVRTSAGDVARIVEERDADDATRAIGEINTSVYAFAAGSLLAALERITTDNAQGEEYLTDVIEILVGDGRPVAAHRTADAGEAAGVNDRVQLAAAGRTINDRLLTSAMRAGATIVDPLSTWLDADVRLAADVTLLPGCQLRGRTTVASDAVIGPRTTLTDTTVEAGATVADSTCTGAHIGPGATVGPYTYLRPGTVLGPGTKAGAYVEIKASRIGEGTKVPHLSYVGDATIGERSNIGAATVFVNFDGVNKHRSTVGDDVRIGSDTMVVAPVSIGDRAYTAAGSVITEDVPPGALGVGRARQRNVEGWVARKRGEADGASDAGNTEKQEGSP